MAEVILDIETYQEIHPAIFEKMQADIRPRGNLKDPKKIEADIEAKKAALFDKAALSPLTGRIVAIGLACQKEDGWDYTVKLAKSAEEEAPMLESLNEYFGDFLCHQLVTFNGRKFDLPFILARAMVHDITLTYRFPVGYDKNHADLRDILIEGSLDYWATLILGEAKNGSAADVAGLVEENKWDELSTYCENDVALTVKIWERMKNATKGLSK